MNRYAEYRDSAIPWVGRIPSSWAVVPLLSVLNERKVKNEHLVERNLLSLSYGRIVRKDIDVVGGLLPASFATYQIVEPDNLVFRFTDLQNDQRSLRTARVVERGIITSAYAAASANGINARYAEYLLRSYDLTKVFYSLGGGVRQSLKFADIARLPILLPSAVEQRAISNYLDRETSHIDTLIKEQQRLIEVLGERRSSVLAAEFDIGPTTKATKVGRLLAVRPSYGVLVPKYVDETEGVPFVRVGDLLNLSPERPMLAISSKQSDEYSRTKIVGGEVLLGVVGKMGQAALAPAWLAGANVARAVAVLRSKDPSNAPLLCAWLGSNHFLVQAELATSGDSIQPTLGMKDLARFDINLPTDPNAAADLANRMANIDALIAESERLISLSKERRAALITAAVTGQIDVREMA